MFADSSNDIHGWELVHVPDTSALFHPLPLLSFPALPALGPLPISKCSISLCFDNQNFEVCWVPIDLLSFVAYTFVVRAESPSPDQGREVNVFCNSFMISGLPCSPLLHFELILHMA